MAATCGLISPIWVWFSVFELDICILFFYFSGQSSFSFCEHLFFYSKEKCFRVSIAAVLASKHKGTN